MPRYLPVVFFISTLIDLILLVAVSKLCECTAKIKNILFAALIGGLHADWCLLPGFHFLGNLIWRLLFLLLKSAIVFGFGWERWRQLLLYMLLNIAASGLPLLLKSHVFWPVVICLLMVYLLCRLFLVDAAVRKYVPIQLLYDQKQLEITALRDTGNGLRDPVTGRPVLVVGADIAQSLTGLTPDQLRRPVESVGMIPGLRLIPFRTVGQNGFLLAMQISNVKIGNWQGSKLVAFAPECVGSPNTFQALIGGTL
jgi:sigma-E processing peptidase SpoIIGA